MSQQSNAIQLEDQGSPARSKVEAVRRRLYRLPAAVVVMAVGAVVLGSAAGLGYLLYSYRAKPQSAIKAPSTSQPSTPEKAMPLLPLLPAFTRTHQSPPPTHQVPSPTPLLQPVTLQSQPLTMPAQSTMLLPSTATQRSQSPTLSTQSTTQLPPRTTQTSESPTTPAQWTTLRSLPICPHPQPPTVPAKLTTMPSPPITVRPRPPTRVISTPLQPPPMTVRPRPPTVRARSTTQELPPTPDHGNGTVCYTSGCLAMADYLKENLNLQIDPCRNVAPYVCGRLADGEISTDNKVLNAIVNSFAPKALSYLYDDTHGGARFKAAFLLAHCTHYWIRQDNEDGLRDFMTRLKLHVYKAPPSAPTGPDDVLALHVELAYTYGFSGLMRIKPREQGSLSIDFNQMDWQQVMVPETNYNKIASDLAITGGFDPLLGAKEAVRRVYQAVKDAVHKAKRNYTARIAAALPVVVIKVQDLAFSGVSPNAFPNAITTKTPYSSEARVFESTYLKFVLENVWRAVNSQDIYFWTSWYVLNVAGPVVSERARSILSTSNEELDIQCVRMVSHVIGAGLAALISLNNFTKKAEAEVTQITNSIADCLKRKSWTAKVPSSPRLVLGLSSYANSTERLDAFYKDVLLVRDNFFESWLLAARMRRFAPMPLFDHVEPFSSDVYTGIDGTLLVPALLSRVPYFAVDGALGANVGGLGHRIAQSLVHRYFDRPDIIPAECKTLGNQERGDDVEALLAYSCVSSVLHSMNANDKQRLPRFPALPPEKLAYAVGCLKDCTIQHGKSATCSGSPQGLREFKEAFFCRPSILACDLS